MPVAQQPHRLSTLDGERIRAADQCRVLVDADDANPGPGSKQRSGQGTGDPPGHAVVVWQHPKVRQQRKPGLTTAGGMAQVGYMLAHRHRSRAASGERRGWLEERRTSGLQEAGAPPADPKLCRFLARCPVRVPGACDTIPPPERAFADGAQALCHHSEAELAALQAPVEPVR